MPHKHQLDFDLKDDRRGKMSEIIKRTLKLTPSFTSSGTELPHSTTSKISKHRFAASCRIPNEDFNAAHRKWNLEALFDAPVQRACELRATNHPNAASLLQSARTRHARLLWLPSIFNKMRLSAKAIMAIAEKQHREWGSLHSERSAEDIPSDTETRAIQRIIPSIRQNSRTRS